MGCFLFSAITFMSNKKNRNICAYYFGCILVRFGRMSGKTDGTGDHRDLEGTRTGPYRVFFTTPAGHRKKDHSPAPVGYTLAVTTEGFLTAFTSRVTVSCSICSTLKLPGPVLQSCF